MPIISKFQDVNPSTTVNQDFVPAAGQKIFLRRLSTTAPSLTTAKGVLIWDPAGENRIIDGWSGDKVIEYDDGSDDFAFAGDGSKILRLQLINTNALSVARIGASLFYILG